MIPALPTPGPWLPLYSLLAVLMVGGNLYFILRLFPRGGSTPTLATAILVLGLLLMSTGLWLAGIYAVLSPGDASTVSVFIAVNSMMAVGGLWAISLLFRSGVKHLPREGVLWPLTFALLIAGNELLMGLTFVLALVGPAPYQTAGWAGLTAAVGDALVSAWFFWAMLGTMAFLVTWLPITRGERALLYGFAAASAIGPWVVPEPVVGALGMSALMVLTFSLLARELWGHPAPSRRLLRTALFVIGGFLVMVVGEALSFFVRGSLGAGAPFGLTSFVVMTAELFLLTRWGWEAPPSTRPIASAEVPRVEVAPSPSTLPR